MAGEAGESGKLFEGNGLALAQEPAESAFDTF
jgi:hypothetical protein